MSDRLKYKQFFSDLTEDYPPAWNIETFKSLKSFSKRIKYCEEVLQRIASGSSRIVYKIDDQKVLKLARNEKGIDQNASDRDYVMQRSYPDVVAKVFDVDENDLWVEMELAKKLTPSRFKEIVGLHIKIVDKYLTYKDDVDKGHGVPPPAFSSEVLEFLENNEWLQRIYSLMRDMDLMSGDLGRISSYGEVIRNGKPAVVLVDAGFTSTVFATHYR